MTPLRIFVSSVQKEFTAERAALRDYLRGDALMRRFFEPFLVVSRPRSRWKSCVSRTVRCQAILWLRSRFISRNTSSGWAPAPGT